MRVLVAEPADDLAVALDGDALGHEVLLDHVDERGALDVLGVAAVGDAVGVEVRRALQLRDAQRDLVGVAELLVGVLEELVGHRTGVEAVGHEVVPLVAQHAHDLGGEGLVEDVDDLLAVGAVGRRDRALLHLRPGPLAEGLDVGQEVAHGPDGTLGPGRADRRGGPMAGWGDDPQLAELRTLVYEDGWRPVSVTEGAGAVDTVVVEKDGEQRTFSSDHIAFHRFVEGVKEDFGL